MDNATMKATTWTGCYDRGWQGLITPTSFSGMAPNDHDLWMPLDLAVLETCRALIVLALPGWSASVGVLAEIKTMKGLGRPVYCLHPDEPVGDVSKRLRELKNDNQEGV
jgi:hypothetical protein